MSLFELRTPRDMLAKARREYERLVQCVDIDNVFNFLVTVHQIRDYVEHSGSVSKDVLKAFALDQDIKDCADLANTGKHLILTRPPRAAPATRVIQSHIGAGHVGEMMVGSGSTWLLESENRSVEIIIFAERLLRKWEAFIAGHGI